MIQAMCAGDCLAELDRSRLRRPRRQSYAQRAKEKALQQLIQEAFLLAPLPPGLAREADRLLRRHGE